MSTTGIPNQTQRQICLCFAYLAYIGAVRTKPTTKQSYQLTDVDILAELKNLMSSTPTDQSSYPPKALPPIAGQWEVVWGPATYTVPGAMYQDNMMYVVQLSDPPPGSPPQYVVAIRGTNGAVLLDWLMQDFDVKQLMPWPVDTAGPGRAHENPVWQHSAVAIR